MRQYSGTILLVILATAFVLATEAFILEAIGFTAAGVAKGSIAAGIQSIIGSVGAGSVFAACQAAGATGAGVLSLIGWTTAAPVAIGGALVAGVTSWFR